MAHFLSHGLALTSAVAVLLGAEAAHAASYSCPSAVPDAKPEAQYTLSSSSLSSVALGCAYGSGHLNASAADSAVISGTQDTYPVAAGDPIPGSNSVYLEKVGPSTPLSGSNPGAFSVNYIVPNSSGEIKFAVALTDALLALVGPANNNDNGNNPQWAVFNLGKVVAGTVLSWSLIQCNKPTCPPVQPLNISHFILYGQIDTNDHNVGQTPIPPALFLFGTGLLGLTVLGRRRRQS